MRIHRHLPLSLRRRDLLVAALGSVMRVRLGHGAESDSARAGEVDALRLFAEQTHPRGRAAAADARWQQSWNRLARECARLADGAYVVALRRALTWFGDGHTTVLPFEYVGGVPPALINGFFGQRLPLRTRIFDDGVRITSAAHSSGFLLGATLRRMGDRSIEEVLRLHAAAWSGNDAWAQRWAPVVLASPGLLQGLGVWANPAEPLPIVVVDATGKEIQARLHAHASRDIELKDLRHAPDPCERWAARKGTHNYLHHLKSADALYLSIDAMEDTKDQTFAAFAQSAIEACESTGAHRLIIDLRRNGGGDNTLPEPLHRYIVRSKFNRPGTLFVLIGPATFSAAQNFATRLERDTLANFVGEPTGGAPNHFGDPKIFTGAATGITAIVSSLFWQDSVAEDDRPWIEPDIPVAATFDDWRQGHDRALQSVLKPHSQLQGIREPSAPADTCHRRSQQIRWRPFWR